MCQCGAMTDEGGAKQSRSLTVPTYHDAAALAKLVVDRLTDQRSLEIMWESEQSLTTGVLLRVR